MAAYFSDSLQARRPTLSYKESKAEAVKDAASTTLDDDDFPLSSLIGQKAVSSIVQGNKSPSIKYQVLITFILQWFGESLHSFAFFGSQCLHSGVQLLAQRNKGRHEHQNALDQPHHSHDRRGVVLPPTFPFFGFTISRQSFDAVNLPKSTAIFGRSDPIQLNPFAPQWYASGDPPYLRECLDRFGHVQAYALG